MIDFESFPGGGSPADGVSIRDQYLLSDGVRFGLNGGGEPVLVRTGNTGTNVFVGASGVMDTLLPGEPDIGNFFLHDDGDPLTTPAGFFMRFMDDKAFVSGMVLDVEPRPTGAREAWRITAFDVNDVALEEIVIDGKDRGDSDSEAVPLPLISTKPSWRTFRSITSAMFPIRDSVWIISLSLQSRFRFQNQDQWHCWPV